MTVIAVAGVGRVGVPFESGDGRATAATLKSGIKASGSRESCGRATRESRLALFAIWEGLTPV